MRDLYVDQPRRRSRRRANVGFTLLELLVVVVIIGLLAGLVAPRYFDQVGKTNTKIAKAQIDSLEKALDQYRLDVGSYPDERTGAAGPERQTQQRREVAGTLPKEGRATRPLGARLPLQVAGRPFRLRPLTRTALTANPAERTRTRTSPRGADPWSEPRNECRCCAAVRRGRGRRQRHRAVATRIAAPSEQQATQQLQLANLRVLSCRPAPAPRWAPATLLPRRRARLADRPLHRGAGGAARCRPRHGRCDTHPRAEGARRTPRAVPSSASPPI